MYLPSRRRFLQASAGVALVPALGSIAPARGAGDVLPLTATSRVIEVNGKPATVLGVLKPDGTPGVFLESGRRFRVDLVNELSEPTLVHWHGLTPPSAQDGVPGLSQPALEPGGTYQYDFALTRPGTYWMHSHQGFQEQLLMAAPLIVRDPAESGLDEQEVVILLQDFTFRDPMEIFAALTGGATPHAHGAAGANGGMGEMSGMNAGDMAGMAGMDHSTMNQGTGGGAMPGMSMGAMSTDLNDVEYDAFLANDRTLADPEVVRVEPGGRVRLRVINASASTNFFIDTGALEGELIRVDGEAIVPRKGQRFPLAIAQRVDIRVQLPAGEGAYPVLALREGDTPRTGVILATAKASVARVPEQGNTAAGAIGLDLERQLVAANPLPAKPADRVLTLNLTGNMTDYVWTLNGAAFGKDTPLPVRQGERVEIVLRNATGMGHPMHLHGHIFQVVAIDGGRFEGATRDTVFVPPNASVTIAFDADNPGRWALHCHNLYHMEAGMMTSVLYQA